MVGAIKDVLFGKESKGAQPFRAPGYEQQFGALNQTALGDLGARNNFLNSFGGQNQGMKNTGLGGIIGQMGFSPQGVGSVMGGMLGGMGNAGAQGGNYTDPRFFRAGQELPQINTTAQNMNPLSFNGRNPYDFNQPQFNLTPFNANTAVGDSFTPFAQQIEDRLARFGQRERDDIIENAGRRGLAASGVLNQALADQRTRERDTLGDALNQLAGNQASQLLAAKQFEPQMQLQQQLQPAQLELNRQMQQANEIFRQMGATDDQARSLTDDSFRRQNELFRQQQAARQLGMQEYGLQNASLQQPYENLLRLASLSSGGTPKQPGSTGLLGGVLGAAGVPFGEELGYWARGLFN